MATNNLRSNHLRPIAARLGQKISITLLTLFLEAGTAARIEAGEWQLLPPDGPGCWEQKVSLAEMKWLPCSHGEPGYLCRDGKAQQTAAASEDTPEEDGEPVIDVTTTALKAVCNKAVNDAAGTLWLLGRAAAATADPTFSEELKSIVDDRTREFLNDWRLTYGPEEQEIGGAFETGYEVIDLGLGAYGLGKAVITTGRKVIAHFGREAAETASGNGLREAVRASSSQTDEVAAAVAPEGIGERYITNPTDLNVDLAVQQYRHAKRFKDSNVDQPLEAAHLAPTSAVREVPGYSRNAADTVLLSREQHRAFDRYWMEWARQRVAEGCTETTVAEFLDVQRRALESVAAIRGRTADTMYWKLFDEYYRQLELTPDSPLRLPYGRATQ